MDRARRKKIHDRFNSILGEWKSVTPCKIHVRVTDRYRADVDAFCKTEGGVTTFSLFGTKDWRTKTYLEDAMRRRILAAYPQLLEPERKKNDWKNDGF